MNKFMIIAINQQCMNKVKKISEIFIIYFLYVPVSGARVEFQGVTPGAISPIFRGTPSSLDRKIYNKHR